MKLSKSAYRDLVYSSHNSDRKNAYANALIEENRRLRKENEKLNQQIKLMEVHT